MKTDNILHGDWEDKMFSLSANGKLDELIKLTNGENVSEALNFWDRAPRLVVRGHHILELVHFIWMISLMVLPH